ncbi:uncharacterized protein F4822DRAFT_64968 [Hypoxylon trugodes]|uniref:uncharacterized protein n=1 Tax=Hypoxylon trugodes TaxID=326681 RepID=UPI00219ACC55|nr:uncharacterized protein F4822DRAFT_64968 [Hypoxylon trugodes]KAI1384260.1 hypothetical protein F4822DRAFT_64968 [Hypoxylon trugodes]
MSHSMSPFNGKHIFNNARSRFKQSQRLKDVIKKLSIKRLKNHNDDVSDPDEVADNDDQSSIGNPVSPAEPGILTLTNNSTSISTLEAEPNDAIVHSTTSSSEPKTSGLLLLPQELFDTITSYLGPAHIVILALVNKELMNRFMTSCKKLELLGADSEEQQSSYKMLNAFVKKADSSKTKIRGTLLSLMDYDLLDLVYCYKCKKLHDPFVTFKDRAYAPHKAIRCADWSMEHHMPSRATRKLLRSITKYRIHGADYKHLLQQVNNTHTFYQKGIMLQVSLRMRYRNEDLLLRRQQVVASIDKSALGLWLFSQQVKHTQPLPIGPSPPTTSPRLYTICNHMSWISVFKPFVDQLINPLCKRKHTEEEGESHTAECFGDDRLDVSEQEGHMVYERMKWNSSGDKLNPMDTPALLGDVLGCKKCTTDFSIDVISLPEPFGWGFILTTWLDLGKLDFCSKWDSHRDARPCRDYNRTFPHGDICETFEDLSSRLDYRPRVTESNLERMHNYGWSERVINGRDKFVNWSSAHTCNPTTGKLEDPDPLEEADY